ncbi:MAG: zinc ribbon domain-containing protein [Candidatus Geothermincolia bacterium]
MAKCVSCGRDIDPGAEFCPHCGAAQTRPGTEPSAAPLAAPPLPRATGAPSPRRPSVFRARPVIIALVLGVIGICALAGVVTLAGIAGIRYIKEPIDLVNDYEAALIRGDAAAAWEMLHPSSDIRRSQTFDEFARGEVKEAQDELRSWRTGSFELDELDTVRIDVDEARSAGRTRRLRFVVVKHDDEWIILDYYLR